MAKTKDLRITELDFEKIKRNYKEFLKSQNEFTDYDFDASGMDVLLDVLAYNTHYNAFYLNSAVNEIFLATANNRANVTKTAQSLNYVPKSKTAAVAYLDLQIIVPEATLINIFGSTVYGIVQLARYTRFTTSIDNKKYVFVNTEPVTLTHVDSETFTATRVEVKQGIPNTFRYTVDATDEYQRFLIQDQNADTSSLTVYSQAPDQTDQTNFVYHKEVNLQDVSSTTPIYFLSENSSGFYEVDFGDGNYGYKPVNNEVIFFNYLVTAGREANGAINFTASSNVSLSGNIINNATVIVTSVERAFGGADRETTESIRYNAPKYFQAQDRAVIANDYAALVKNLFSSVEAVNVWGGEQNNPPKFGKVFITVKPFGSLYFTESEKNQIANRLQEKMISPIRPVMTDPKYTYLDISITTKYNSKRTLKRASDIKNQIVSVITQYSQENLEKFTSTFYYSRFTELVNSVDDAIESNMTSIRLKKEFTPEIKVAKAYTFYFQNSILYPYTGYKGSITSSPFVYNGFQESRVVQRSDGKLSIISQPTGSVETTVVENAGEVDYANGAIVLKSFAPDSFEGGFIELFVTPSTTDVSAYREFIFRIQESDISITMQDITKDVSLTGSLLSATKATDVSVDVSTTAY